LISAANGSIVNVPVRTRNSVPYIAMLTRIRPPAYVFFVRMPTWQSVSVSSASKSMSKFLGTVKAFVVQTAELSKTKFDGIAGNERDY
jgi:hypothetical protein